MKVKFQHPPISVLIRFSSESILLEGTVYHNVFKHVKNYQFYFIYRRVKMKNPSTSDGIRTRDPSF
jgi:hypothetical protein